MGSESIKLKAASFWRYIRRVLVAASEGFIADDCYSKASALTYYSVLSLVPILAVALGIAKGFGFEVYLENEVQRGILEQREAAQQIISFAYLMLENARGGIIACIGVVALLWTAVQLLGNIESYFNDIWKIPHARHLVRRFTDYLAILILCPIFLVVSSSLSVYVITILNELPMNGLLEPFSGYLVIFYHALPYALSWALFSFMYVFIPNAKVRWRNALTAALIAGIIYQIVQRIYIYFQIGVASYGAVYGSLAALPLFLVWIHVSWLIALAGAELTYYSEVIPYVMRENDFRFVNEKQLALWICSRCTRGFMRGEAPLSNEKIADELGTSQQIVRKIALKLYNAGILAQIHHEEYLLAKSPENITLKGIETALDESLGQRHPVKIKDSFEHYENYLQAFNNSIEASPVNISLKELFDRASSIKKF